MDKTEPEQALQENTPGAGEERDRDEPE